MDDAGMSYDSDIGIEQVLEKGAACSLSVMMPTPWVRTSFIKSRHTLAREMEAVVGPNL
jgi:hypothetical protein